MEHIVSAPRLVVDGELTGPGAVVVRDGRIADVLDHVPSRAPHHTELRDGLLSAGLVDLQVNGFAGTDLIAADDAGWDDVRRRLPATGVTAFVATYITAPLPDLLDGLRRATRAADRWVADGARLLGVHLEGPFLSAARRGAHDAALMTDPHPDAVEAILAAGPPAIVTLAPERATALAAIARLHQAGVVVSLGHTDADVIEAAAGVDSGARMVTHLFNAMRPLHHRAPGLAGVALTDERLVLGLICDLHHVDPLVCALVFRAAPDRVALVSDAIAAAGMPAGRYELGGDVVVVDQAGGLPRREDGTIAGSSLTLDRAVRNAVACGAPPARAIAAASQVPARLLGHTDLGVLAPGARADLVWWSDDLQHRSTWLAGRPAPARISR